MPRLATSLVKQAKRIHPLLPLLLQPCRNLDSARNELRWLAEYQRQLKPRTGKKKQHRRSLASKLPTLLELCIERSHGRPLQYILGTQPFGELEILCRKGVLIPRVLTESYVNRLVSTLLFGRSDTPIGSHKPKLKIADLCTGTGCILLLLYAKLAPYYNIEAIGVDISERAVQLAERNLRSNIASGALPKDAAKHIHFRQLDIWKADYMLKLGKFDIVTNNPPYITEHELRTQTERSVRLFEPRTALVGREFASLWDYAMVAVSLFDPEKGGLLLIECLDEAAATQYMNRLIKWASQQYLAQCSLPPYGRNIDALLWREGSAKLGRDSPRIRNQLRLHGFNRDGTSTRAKFSGINCLGPLQALVVSYGFSGANKLYRKSNERATNDEEPIRKGQTRFARDDARKARDNMVQNANEPTSGGDQALPPPAHSDVSQGKLSPREAHAVAGLVESISQNVMRLRNLSVTLQKQRHVDSKLLEGQAALGAELKKVREMLERK